ncbi:MAG TPA: hypothetical protein VFO65_04750, partial [Acidimicrobiales bacterium]|nr:hypothetical protein [Acidimicrobiales bacterium]
TVTAFESSTGTAHWSGTGRYAGQDGYTFEVWVVDNGSGSGRRAGVDSIRLVVRDAAGATVADTAAPLQGGNLTVHR